MINQKTINAFGVDYSEAGLQDMTGAELVSLYNTIASNLNDKSVRKFKDLATGTKRTWAMLEHYEAWMQKEEVLEDEDQEEDDFDEDFDKPKEEVIPVKKTSKAKTGVSAFITKQLKSDEKLTAKQIIEQVREKFPTSKASTRDVAWYKCKLNVKKSNVS